MPVGATLGAATIGAGASIASSNAQNSAARQQSAAAQSTADQQTRLYRDIFNQQRADFEPFRQSELRRSGLADRILGIGGPSAGAVPGGFGGGLPGAPAGAQGPGPGMNYLNAPNNADVLQAFNTLTPTNSNFIAQQGYDANGDGSISGEEFGNFHYNVHGARENRQGFTQAPQAGQAVFNPKGGPDPSIAPQLAGTQAGQTALGFKGGNDPSIAPQVTGTQSAGITVGEPNPATVGQSTPVFDPSIAGATEFNDSLFAAALQANNRRDMSAIDQNLAAQGLAYSGAQQQATADAVTRNTQGGLNNFLNFLLGAPSAGAATQGSVQAGQNFASQTGNALGNLGAAQQQSAFQQGQNQANLFGNLATAGGSALGAFSLGGKKLGGKK